MTSDADRPARWMLVAVALWAATIAVWGPVAPWVPGWVRAGFAIPVAALCLGAAVWHTRTRVLVGLAVSAGFGAWNIIRILITDYPPRTVVAGVAANGVITVAALALGAYVDALDGDE